MTLAATLVIALVIGATEVVIFPIRTLSPTIGKTEVADLLLLLPVLTIGATEVADLLLLLLPVPALTTGTEVVALRRPLLPLLQALTTEAGAGLHAGALTNT